MSISSRALRALSLAPVLGLAASLAAQSPSNSSPQPQLRLASALEGGDSRDVTVKRSATVVSIDREAYVLAYRRAARIACRIGLPDALNGALKDARAGLGTLPDVERTDVSRALDSAYTRLEHDGGCAILVDATKLIVVNGVDGFAWNTPLSKISKPSKGTYNDDGFFVLSRDSKLGGVNGEVTMTFTALKGSEKLVSGRYRLALDAQKCGEQWLAIEHEILSRYPSLRVMHGSDAPSASACDESASRWTTAFRNPDTDALELSMSMRHGADDRLYMVVDLPGMPGYAAR